MNPISHQIKHDYKFKEGCLLLEHEEPVVPVIQTGLPGRQSYSRETLDWLRCQTILNRSVAMLINGDSAFSRRHPTEWIYHYLYPVPEWWRGVCHKDITGPYTTRLQRHLGKERITAKKLYAALKEAERFLLEPPKEILTDPQRIIVQEWPSHMAIHPAAGKMRKILLPVNNNISVYVHGSMATGDYTPFSDVDDLVILHSNSWESYKSFKRVIRCLEKTATLFQSMDPLQHHGHWVFLDFDMVCLDQSTMPLVVLENAIVVAGRQEIVTNIRSGSLEFGRVLWNIVQEVRHEALSLVQGTINLYGLKNLVAGISILPPLTFQVQGQIVAKKTAILTSTAIFSEEAQPALRWATKIREEWTACPGYRWVERQRRINRLLPVRRGALEAIARNHSPRLSLDEVPFLDTDTVSAVFKLTDEATEHLRKVLLP